VSVTVAFSDDPAFVLTEAKRFLASEPVLHYLVLTPLHKFQPGSFWIAQEHCFEGEKGETVGVVQKTGPQVEATMTPTAIAAAVDAIAKTGNPELWAAPLRIARAPGAASGKGPPSTSRYGRSRSPHRMGARLSGLGD
jgi:hypothetical protein